MRVEMPAVAFVCYLSRDAAASDFAKAFHSSKFCECDGVFAKAAVCQNREVALRGHEVFWLADAFRPKIHYSLPSGSDFPLTTRTPFEAALVKEAFDCTAAFACSENLFMSASGEV